MITRDQTVLLGGYCFSDIMFFNSALLYDTETQYIAPELFQKNDLTQAVDIWSIGVLIYSLYNGLIPPFKNIIDIIDYSRNTTNLDLSFLPRRVANLISSCLVPNPEERISIKEIHSSIDLILNSPNDYISNEDAKTNYGDSILIIIIVTFSFPFESKIKTTSKQLRILTDIHSPHGKSIFYNLRNARKNIYISRYTTRN